MQAQCNKIRNKGFTLIELAFVLMIAGLITLVIWQSVKVYIHQWQSTVTQENIKQTNQALQGALIRLGRYPCPADPSLEPGDAGYGEEICRTPPLNPDDCASITPPPSDPLNNIECLDIGSRDADGDGNEEIVWIGAFPWKTVSDVLIAGNYEERSSYDGFNMKLSYAVTEIMTDNSHNNTDPVPSALGGINIIDEHNNVTISPPKSAHYVIFSHGNNKTGAHTRSGDVVENCDISAIYTDVDDPSWLKGGKNITGSGVQTDLENCDNNDAIFTNAILSLGDNDNYNDDTLVYRNASSQAFWQKNSSFPEYIYNTNIGQIGVGVDDPQSKLHIAGDINTKGAVQTNIFCELGGPDTICSVADALSGARTDCGCILPEYIGGSGSSCTGAANEVAVGIENNKLVCRQLFSAKPTQECPIVPSGGNDPGQTRFVSAISNSGTVCCNTLNGNDGCCLPSAANGLPACP